MLCGQMQLDEIAHVGKMAKAITLGMTIGRGRGATIRAAHKRLV